MHIQLKFKIRNCHFADDDDRSDDEEELEEEEEARLSDLRAKAKRKSNRALNVAVENIEDDDNDSVDGGNDESDDNDVDKVSINFFLSIFFALITEITACDLNEKDS